MPKIDRRRNTLPDRPGPSSHASPTQRAAQPPFFSAQIADARRFHLQLRPATGKRLTVFSGGVERCAPDYRVHRTSFPFTGLEFVAGGSGMLELNRRQIRLVPGTLFLYGQDTPHRIESSAAEPLVKYFVDFSGGDLSRILRSAHLSPATAWQTSAPAEVMPIFDEIIRNGVKNTAQSGEICAALLEALLLKLVETRVPLGSVESAAFATYQNCRRELEAHALDITGLEDLAARCHTAPAYLCRLFRRFDRESPYHQLMRLKMSHAAAKLHAPGTLVKQVAADLGFSDPYHFTRTFKRIFGLSPTHLVREQRPGG